MAAPDDSLRAVGPDGSRLCVQCGLCCDGTLFSHLPVDDADAGRVASLGATLETRVAKDGTEYRALVLGCSLLEERRCCAYDDRPRGCQSYACRLLHDFRSEKRSLEQCIEIVRAFEQAVAEAASASAHQQEARTSATDETDLLTIGVSDALRMKYF